MSVDPRTPVLIGVGQLSHRVDRGATPLEPVDLMAEALRLAATDSGAGTATLARADSVQIVATLSWRYRDPGRLVADRVGAQPRDSAVSGIGGNSPQSLVNAACLAIQRGEADHVLIAGAEAWRTRMKERAAGERPDWTTQGDDVPAARQATPDVAMSAPAEQAVGVVAPIQVYPLIEQAFRIAQGRKLDEHLDALARLWSAFSEVAADNPHAWVQQRFTPEQLRSTDDGNRWVGFPYPKLMNSNPSVEQAAALILCSAERAAALGVPRDRWVFPHSGADAHDHYFVSERDSLGASPAIRLAGTAALSLAGVGPDDLSYVDLYSCFPCAVEVAATELGLSLDRPLTVTGGLSFAGGPWNNYVTHSIATMAGRLRADPDAVGLVTANGGFLTKHAIGVYAAHPPRAEFRYAEPQPEVDALPRRDGCSQLDVDATIEAWTVMHDGAGQPETAHITALLGDGRRGWATSTEADVLTTLMTEDVAAAPVRLQADGAFTLAP
ncbi:MAG TPA: acetyl-CoA acetyltransferase [Mycobacteriales bacterium]|nr:acetyl-CoA acetyltransferase [Mycobacteriales bacterium]